MASTLLCFALTPAYGFFLPTLHPTTTLRAAVTMAEDKGAQIWGESFDINAEGKAVPRTAIDMHVKAVMSPPKLSKFLLSMRPLLRKLMGVQELVERFDERDECVHRPPHTSS